MSDKEGFEPVSAAEKREFARYEVTAYVDYTGSEILLYHRIENISLGGICLQTSSVEDLGTIVDLVINFPDLDDETLSARGEVVWANREPPMDMGIRFLGLDEDRKKILRDYLGRVRKP